MPGLGDLLVKENPSDRERELLAREIDRIDNAVQEYSRILGPRGSIQLLQNDVLELNSSGGFICEWVLEVAELRSQDSTLVLNSVVPFISLDMPDGIQADESGIYFGRDPADGLAYLRGYGAGVVKTELRASDGVLGLAELAVFPPEFVINEAGLDVNIRIESDNKTEAVYIDGQSGHVGLGTSSVYLDRKGLYVYWPAFNYAGIGSGGTINIIEGQGVAEWTSDLSQWMQGLSTNVIYMGATNVPNSAIVGGDFYARHHATGSIGQVIGVNVQARGTSGAGGNITSITGGNFQTSVSCNATNLFGIFSDAYNTIADGATHTITQLVGIYDEAFAKASGTAGSNAVVTTAYGLILSVHAKRTADTTSHIGTAYAAYLCDHDFNDPGTLDGTIDTWYGLYVKTPTIATTKYPIYVEGGTSYFGGTITVSASGAFLTIDSTSTSSSGLVFYSDQATQWNLISHIDFYGRDSTAADTQYASLRAYIGDPANGAEGGAWALEAMAAGTSRVLLKGYFAGTAGEVVVNEDAINLDFRVETDTNQYGLHVDAQLESVGIMQAGESGFALAVTGAQQIKGAGTALLYIRETSTGNAAVYIYDTTDGGYVWFSKDNLFILGKVNTSGAWTADLVSVSTGGGITSVGDVYPVSSGQGLNTRFERLFGDDVPAGPYAFTRRGFWSNNFVGHTAGFDDSQSTPYSFGGSPGSFSLVDPGSSRYAASDIYRHFLYLQNYGSAGALYVRWSNATGKANIRVDLAVGPHCTSTDNYIGEIRVWGVQSPGGSDKYYALRFTWIAARKQVETALYYGTGVTFTATDGTLVGSSWAIAGGAVYQNQLSVAATPAGYAYTYISEGFLCGGNSTAPGAGYPTVIKECWIRVETNTWNALFIDAINLW